MYYVYAYVYNSRMTLLSKRPILIHIHIYMLIYLFLYTINIYNSVVFIRDYSTDAKLAKEVGGQNYNPSPHPHHPLLLLTTHSPLT